MRNKLSTLFGTKIPERKNFKKRVFAFWTEFERKEAHIRQMMNNKTDGNILVKKMSNVLQTAFQNMPFEMGINDDNKHELIFSPNGNHILLIQIIYLLKNRPKYLDDKWNFYSSKPAQGTEELELSIYDINITANDFLIYTDLDAERKIINMEVFVPILMELEQNYKYNALFIALDLYIGELYTMEYVGKVDIIDNKKSDEFDDIPLSKFKSYIDYLITEHNWEKPQNITENYIAYKAEGLEHTRKLRNDAYIGYSSCFQIIQDLEQKDIFPIKHLEADGIYMGYIFYNNSSVEQEDMIPQRAEIEDRILELVEEQGIANNTGGATGYNNSYIDFIIYDLDAFISIAQKIMSEYRFSNKGFEYFQSQEKTITFK